jgi:hypothetical protein
MIFCNKFENLTSLAMQSGASCLRLDESLFNRICQDLEPQYVAEIFDEFSEMQIRPNLGLVAICQGDMQLKRLTTCD